MKARLLLALLVGLAAPAAATDADFGTTNGPFGTSNGAVLFYQTGTRTGTIPSCASISPTRWAINASTAAGQSQLSVFLTAYTLHKRIFIHGTGTCTIWGDTETIDWFAVEN